jgi:hypothetical protein
LREQLAAIAPLVCDQDSQVVRLVPVHAHTTPVPGADLTDLEGDHQRPRRRRPGEGEKRIDSSGNYGLRAICVA